MLRQLGWRAPSHGTIAAAHDPTLVPDRYRTLKDGTIVRIEGPKIDPDEGCTFLQVREADLPDLHGALQWFCNQSEIPIPGVVGRDGGIVRLKIRGDFTPSPSVEDLAQIVADYKLLGARFESWAAVVKRSAREVEATEALVLALAQRSKGIENGLLWAVRALEIRNEVRR